MEPCNLLRAHPRPHPRGKGPSPISGQLVSTVLLCLQQIIIKVTYLIFAEPCERAYKKLYHFPRGHIQGQGSWDSL